MILFVLNLNFFRMQRNDEGTEMSDTVGGNQNNYIVENLK